MQRIITSIKDVETLFPEKLLTTFHHPYPDSENNLKKHVSKLLNEYQHDINGQFQILRYASMIDSLNLEIEYWIIKTGFEIPSATGMPFQNFLLDLIPCIPHSSFLWFYLQHDIDNEALASLFEKYRPANIHEIMQKINIEFVKKYLSLYQPIKTPELVEACICYAIGEFQKTFDLCKKIISQIKTGLNIPESENTLNSQLMGKILDGLDMNPEKITQALQQSFTNKNELMVLEFTKKNFNMAINLYQEIMDDTKNLSQYSLLQIHMMHVLAGNCYEKIQEKSKALDLYEKTYPKMVHHHGEDHKGTQSILRSMTCLIAGIDTETLISNQSKKKSPSIQSDLYKSARILLQEGVDRCNKKDCTNQDYEIAIKSVETAISLYIREKNTLSSRECAECYSVLASCYRNLGKLNLAEVKCNMAYAIASQFYRRDAQNMLDIQIKLHGIELKIAARDHGVDSIECAEAHKKLGLTLEILKDKNSARVEYQACLDIYEKVYGSKDSRTTEMARKLESLQNIRNFSRTRK